MTAAVIGWLLGLVVLRLLDWEPRGEVHVISLAEWERAL